jgi:hypothetical protein
MSGRRAFLNPPALLFVVLATLLDVGAAQAHRLNAQAFLLPNRQVQIEAWFSTGEAAKGAKVEVRDGAQQLVSSGQLNGDGVYVFSFTASETLDVSVTAGGGHRAQLLITGDQLAAANGADTTGGPRDSPSGYHRRSEPIAIGTHDADMPVKDILIGAGFVLALAAFVLSLRNARKLRDLKITQLAEKAPPAALPTGPAQR